MSNLKRKADFFETEYGLEIVEELRTMAASAVYNTESSYSANTNLYPDHIISFVEKHKTYLLNHPETDPQHYLANLRLMTKIR